MEQKVINRLNEIHLNSETNKLITEMLCHEPKPINLYAAKYIRELEAELAEFREAEADGLLVRIPCKAGDAVYVIDTDPGMDSYIQKRYIDNIVLCEDGEILLKGDHYDDVICTAENIIYGTPYLDYYRIFLTREEAEAALKEE